MDFRRDVRLEPKTLKPNTSWKQFPQDCCSEYDDVTPMNHEGVTGKSSKRVMSLNESRKIRRWSETLIEFNLVSPHMVNGEIGGRLSGPTLGGILGTVYTVAVIPFDSGTPLVVCLFRWWVLELVRLKIRPISWLKCFRYVIWLAPKSCPCGCLNWACQ